MLQTSERYAAEYAVKQMVRRFIGPQQQVPPMYSAVKVNGQKLYDLARKGREVERPARDIIVHEMELLDFDENAQKGTLRCKVSKGTYVRTLVNDLLNCFVPLYAATAHNLSQGANTHPLPRIGDVKRYLIRQRPHFIADFLIRSIIGTFEIPTPPVAALTQASHFDVKILLAGVNPSPPCRPRAGTSRQHCRKVSVKIGFGNMAEPDHSGLP